MPRGSISDEKGIDKIGEEGGRGGERGGASAPRPNFCLGRNFLHYFFQRANFFMNAAPNDEFVFLAPIPLSRQIQNKPSVTRVINVLHHPQHCVIVHLCHKRHVSCQIAHIIIFSIVGILYSLSLSSFHLRFTIVSTSRPQCVLRCT